MTIRFSKIVSALSIILLAVSISACSVETKATNKLSAAPVIDSKLSDDDFGFPSKSPSLKQGKTVFENNCAACHAPAFYQQDKVKRDLAVTTPIDFYLMLSTGKAHPVVNPSAQRQQVLPANHPAFKDKLSRDERWAVLFYARYLAGAGDMQPPGTAPKETIASIYGGNCAVCHGTRGLADGPLHVGKTGSHSVMNAEVKENLVPPPARFHDDYQRMYNRSDAQLLKYVCEGIYPSAMPAWYGDVHRDYKIVNDKVVTDKVVYVFNESLISNLVKHVRTFAYENDLDPSDPLRVNPPKGLPAFANCQNAKTNQPWTNLMQHAVPRGQMSNPTPVENPASGHDVEG